METLLKNAVMKKQKALSEYDSKLLLAGAGVPVTRESLATHCDEAIAAASEIGYPVAVKGCDHNLMHKTESGMVHLNISDEESLIRAYNDITSKDILLQGVLVQEMVRGSREFVAGVTRDETFGPCVMFGLGGIFTEALKDITFRVAPLSREDADEMIRELRAAALLDEFRGSPAVDRKSLIDTLVGISDCVIKYPEIAEIDINPLIIAGSRPVAADALVILSEG